MKVKENINFREKRHFLLDVSKTTLMLNFLKKQGVFVCTI